MLDFVIFLLNEKASCTLRHNYVLLLPYIMNHLNSKYVIRNAKIKPSQVLYKVVNLKYCQIDLRQNEYYH